MSCDRGNADLPCWAQDLYEKTSTQDLSSVQDWLDDVNEDEWDCMRAQMLAQHLFSFDTKMPSCEECGQ